MNKFFLVILAFLQITLFAQNIDVDAAKAEDEFKYGVMAYNGGYLNQAYVRFEKALSYKPHNQLYRFWLGKVNYNNGYSNVAVDLWKSLVKEKYKPDFLNNKIELINQKYKVDDFNFFDYKYVNSNKIDNKIKSVVFFRNPISLVPSEDGGFLLTSFANGDIIKYDVNSNLEYKIAGTVLGFKKPFDIIAGDEENTYFVSDFNSDSVLKISSLGFTKVKFGGPGRGDGEFYGPQFLSLDGKGYIFVSDTGNKRISKFDVDGNFILNFGTPQLNFDGFLLPTGVLVVDELVYVADQRLKSIFVFDLSGNYVKTICKKKLKAPEGLTLSQDRKSIIIADSHNISEYNLITEKLSVITTNEGLSKRVTKAIVDKNSNIVAVDEMAQRVDYHTNMNFLYSGFDAEIQSINTLDFPNVFMNISVKSQDDKPFIGLSKNNFTLYENDYIVEDYELIYDGNNEKNFSAVILMDRALDVDKYKLSCEYVLTNLLNQTSKGDSIDLLSVSSTPIFEDNLVSPKHVGEARIKSFVMTAIATNDKYGNARVFDLSLREGVTRLLTKGRKKAIIFVTTGLTSDKNDFNTFALKKLVEYSSVNNVVFYYIVVGDGSKVDTSNLDYIAKKTNGFGIYHDSSVGVSNIIDDIKKSYTSQYTIHYISKGISDYGRNYFSSKVEIHHFNRTGSVESGFFAPRELP